MHDLISYHIPEAVRIHIHAVDENEHPLLDKNGRLLALNQFSVDPQITNFSVLESIIVKAFNLNGDYTISYLNRSFNEYVHLKSDWELECAYLGNAKPLLDIRVQKTLVPNLNDDSWDVITSSDLNRVATYAGKQTSQFANTFFNKMEKMVFKAFNKAQFEDELDENCNRIANINELQNQNQNQNQNQKQKHKLQQQQIASQANDNQSTPSTTFSKFNLLSKFKRRSTLNNETHCQQIQNQKTNHQVIQELTSQSNELEKKKKSNSTNNAKSDSNGHQLNVSTNSICSSHHNLKTKREMNKKQRMQKKDFKIKQQFNLNKIKRISSIQDNQILHKILGKVNTSKTNLYEPLNEQQYLKYLHPDGRIKCIRELRLAIYRRGIESSLRPTLYKHLLNVYPPNMTSEQRVRFVQQKVDQYFQLCFTWQRNFSHSKVQQIHSQVRKDVLRTDRSHPFYVSKCNMDTEQQNDITSSVSTYSSILTQFDMQTNESESMNSSYTCNYSTPDPGIDQQVTNGVYENRNVQALTNILTTYALNHKIGYWQGLSDLCSPLLLAIQNEAETYICFTALMRRLSANFCGDEVMAHKFDCLRKLLKHYDPEFFDYLEKQQASDLLFCYRWLLLELKREFKLDNSLYMLEVSWAAMPPQFYPDLPMYNKIFVPTADESTTIDESELKKKVHSSSKSVSKSQESGNYRQQQQQQRRRQETKLSGEMDAESVNSSKTISNSVSPKLAGNHSSSQINFGNKFKDNSNVRNLKDEMSNAANDLGKQFSNGVNQIKKSVNEVANVASEFYANLNNQSQSQQTKTRSNSSVRSTVRSTLRGLKLSSVEELACKREKFHQQNASGRSVNSLNEMQFSMDKESECGNQRKSKNSSLNGSNHSLIEYNNTLNYILNKTQAMFKQQEQKFKLSNFNLNVRKQSLSSLSLFTGGKECNKENQRETNTMFPKRPNYRHIRFLPKILSTDSNDNTIDSPDADDLNEKCGGNFSHLINKQFSIDSVDSLEFNNDCSSTLNSNQFYNNYKSSPLSNNRQTFNNFNYFSNFNSLPFATNLPFTKQNSIPNQATLLKQQLKQSFNQQQTHFYHLKQRSLPSSPLFKKKLTDTFDRPFLPFLQNVSSMFTPAGQQQHPSSFATNYNNYNYNYNTASNRTPQSTLPLSSRRSKLVSNQFDSFDQRDLFVHCNGEKETMSNSSTVYNSNWKPERGLLNSFNSTSFEAPPFPPQQSINQSMHSSHQRLARQLSDKLINEKMYNSSVTARQSSCEERDGKRILTHTLSGQLTRLNSNIVNSSQQNHQKNQSITTPTKVNRLIEQQHLKTNSSNSSTNTTATTYEKEEKSEGYCSGSISDRNSNCEESCNNHLESDTHSRLMFTNTFSNSTTSLKSSSSNSSSSSSISSLSCSSSLVILSSNTSFRSKIAQVEKVTNTLPSPRELSGSGTCSATNAFSLFICLTILLLHRDKIINENLDANDMAIYFASSSHVRRHDVHLVVNIARELFQVYLNKWQGYKIAEEADQSILDSMLIAGQID